MRHNGKKALITGGTRGIGRAIAIGLASEGCELGLNYLDNDETANATLAQIRAAGGKAVLLKANISDTEGAKALADATLQALGPIDFLIHCAALGTFKPVMELRSNQWDLSFGINVKSLLILTQKLSKSMKPGSSVLALSSSGAVKVVPNYGATGISKAALEALVRYMAAELAGSNIRVNAVSAGPVETRSLDAFPHAAEMAKELASRTPFKRLGKPEDLTGLISFLCSDDSAWITGQTIVADGGLSLV